ncbi:MAG: hypothetical protein IOC39_24220 [Burkholderia sp.]|jgi:hypothetical protein|uniref:hypothetical protein n=1 Tax=Burkholderia sp. TaxID=36773 RepID=UPI002588C7EA|nr:hypothetical protein [Burkholderia sp.]MCA3780131.1 hypothetical protein [Burkholderia sp.]MCA3796257.1 hypothetical protein [Burkholderia sp.]MCA3802908.1 hypothetical protein [Burkholderia sp.]MCA3810859.1 hypothetical protein [Burkholderia sp.]MCA3818927.1 hypothetical protein [Burkholderia sp.]
MLERIKALTEKIRSNIEHRHDLADTLDQLGNKVAALESRVGELETANEALLNALEAKFGEPDPIAPAPAAAPAEAAPAAAPVQVETAQQA